MEVVLKARCDLALYYSQIGFFYKGLDYVTIKCETTISAAYEFRCCSVNVCLYLSQEFNHTTLICLAHAEDR